MVFYSLGRGEAGDDPSLISRTQDFGTYITLPTLFLERISARYALRVDLVEDRGVCSPPPNPPPLFRTIVYRMSSMLAAYWGCSFEACLKVGC